MNKKIVLPLAAVVLVVAAAAAGLWLSRAPVSDPNRLTLYGNVDIRQVSLAFNAGERIRELRVSEGDSVHAGQALGVLDTRTLQLRLAEGEAQIGVQQQV